jgi:hypothetical protein
MLPLEHGWGPADEERKSLSLASRLLNMSRHRLIVVASCSYRAWNLWVTLWQLTASFLIGRAAE